MSLESWTKCKGIGAIRQDGAPPRLTQVALRPKIPFHVVEWANLSRNDHSQRSNVPFRTEWPIPQWGTGYSGQNGSFRSSGMRVSLANEPFKAVERLFRRQNGHSRTPNAHFGPQ